jgi:hypothetical protein
LQWLTWITEEELHQTVQQEIEQSTQEYHRYLEITYGLRSLHHCMDNPVEERMMMDLHMDVTLSASETPMQPPTLCQQRLQQWPHRT